MNNMYTTLLTQVNKLFGEEFLLRDNIPDDIIDWMYSEYKINLQGKLLPITAIRGDSAYIIKDNNINYDTIIHDIILVGNQETKIMIISSNFLEMEVRKVQDIITMIYEGILDNVFKFKKGALYKVNEIAPYILTYNTMNLMGLPFDELDVPQRYINIVIESMDYNVDELLNKGKILEIIEKYQ